jgi:hypothetical protein
MNIEYVVIDVNNKSYLIISFKEEKQSLPPITAELLCWVKTILLFVVSKTERIVLGRRHALDQIYSEPKTII